MSTTPPTPTSSFPHALLDLANAAGRKRSHQEMAIPTLSSDTTQPQTFSTELGDARRQGTQADQAETHEPSRTQSAVENLPQLNHNDALPTSNGVQLHGEARDDTSEESSKFEGDIAPFDWYDFEMKFHQEMEQQDQAQHEVLDEFVNLTKVGQPLTGSRPLLMNI
ncbi:MAG: hypothetical protein M1833_002610 [Piccolia ochrophora]|nr:MAG: hypothetical protein M1833_002610 [Piccolia ochrophora]